MFVDQTYYIFNSGTPIYFTVGATSILSQSDAKNVQIYISQGNSNFFIPQNISYVGNNVFSIGDAQEIITYPFYYSIYAESANYTLLRSSPAFVPGGSLLSRTENLYVTFIGPQGETAAWEYMNGTVPANYLNAVSFSNPGYNYTSYNVYANTVNGLVLQNSTPIPLTSRWVEPSTGLLTAGASAVTSFNAIEPSVIGLYTINNPDSALDSVIVTTHVTDNYSPANNIENATVIYTINNISYSSVTDANGIANICLSPGSYYFSVSAPGYSYNATFTPYVVTGETYSQTNSAIVNIVKIPNGSPSMCNLSYYFVNSLGNPEPGFTFNYQVISEPGYTPSYSGPVLSSPASDIYGHIVVTLPQNTWVVFTINGVSYTIQVPLLSLADLNALINATVTPSAY